MSCPMTQAAKYYELLVLVTHYSMKFIMANSGVKGAVFDFTFLNTYLGESGRLALLLDYDGTLAPLAPRPELAVLPAETKEVLLRLSKRPDVKLAIISGRKLANVKSLVGIEGIVYAGNHGIEIEFPSGRTYVHPSPEGYQEKLLSLQAELESKVCKHGAWVENKGPTLTLHYRAVPEAERPGLVAEAERVVRETGLTVGTAHCALEVKTPFIWNKGHASLLVMSSEFGEAWQGQVPVIFVGDDTTDEDAFEALKDFGQTFRVVRADGVSTAAKHRLSGTDGVLALLKWLDGFLSQRSARS
ncbi:uncharacterized protein LOC134542428 [Bacillus rossius redtenbacheri]|uniref:uncharacterized protein LOC134542428 n=1 Tax=Bacillus rossius redtenbacheri TaxID=93214 RepID=UPI002FDEAE33